MAERTIYIPCYEMGADGRKAYELVAVTGTVSKGRGMTVPAGLPMVSSRVITLTPPAKLQPKGNQDDSPHDPEE